jgi:hypothetical protein
VKSYALAFGRTSFAALREVPELLPSSRYDAVASVGADAAAHSLARRLWIPLFGGFVCGLLFMFALSQANYVSFHPATPAGSRLPTSKPHPYTPDTQIGMGQRNSNSGAEAPFRGSASQWRDEDAPLTATALSITSPSRRV